jgi:hypothetical protein
MDLLQTMRQRQLGDFSELLGALLQQHAGIAIPWID